MDYKLEALDKSVRIALSNGDDNTERIIDRAKAFSDFLVERSTNPDSAFAGA